MKFMSDTSLAELVTKIKDGFLPVKSITAIRNADNANLNNYLTTGVFVIGGMGADTVPGDLRIGYLIVLKYSSTSVAQFWIEKNVDSTYLDYPVFCRHFEHSSWSNWARLPSVENISDLQTAVNGKVNTSDFTLSNITGTLSIAKGGTGATDKYNALANLMYNIVPSSTPPYAKDLSYYATQTISYFSSSAAATGNIPTGSSGVGMLIVITPERGDLYQVWIEMSSGHDTYVRSRIANTWSSWEKITGTVAVAKGGTGATTAAAARTNLGLATTDYTSSVTALNSTDVTNLRVYKTLDRVFVEGYVSVLPTSTSQHHIIAAQLPTECTPTVTARGTAYRKPSGYTTDSKVYPFEVTTSGRIVVIGIIGTQTDSTFERQSIYISTSYHVDN